MPLLCPEYLSSIPDSRVIEVMSTPARYSFVTTFSLNAPHAAVWDALSDFRKWKSWWGAVRKISVTGEKPHQTIHITVGHFGYALSFSMHVEKTHIGKEIAFSSEGDLDGAGRFVLDLGAPVSTVAFHWNAATTKGWMNFLAPMLHQFFIFSHGLVMREFVHGLGRRLDAEVLEYRNTGRYRQEGELRPNKI